MTLNRIVGIALLVFVVVLAIVVAKQMSTEAMAVVIGVVCGVAAGIPTSLLLLLALTWRDRRRLENVERQVRHKEYPPVVVIQGGQALLVESGTSNLEAGDPVLVQVEGDTTANQVSVVSKTETLKGRDEETYQRVTFRSSLSFSSGTSWKKVRLSKPARTANLWRAPSGSSGAKSLEVIDDQTLGITLDSVYRQIKTDDLLIVAVGKDHRWFEVETNDEKLGTLRVLEELISDITDWEGTVVECFRRLARSRHGLDPKPGPLAGRLSATLPGGWADLRRPVAAQLPDTPFDEYHHTADVRQHRGLDGRYGIPKLAFHLYRLAAFRVTGVAPRKNAAGDGFVFDPSGRDVPLYMKRNRPEKPGDWQKWRSAREWELPAPMRCRVLGHAEFEITYRVVMQLVKDNGLGQAPADELRLWQGVRIPSEHRLRLVLERFTHSASLLAPVMYEALLANALMEDCGKRALVPVAVMVEEVPGGSVACEQIVAGNLEAWAANAPGKRLVIDPERGRFRFLGASPTDCAVTYHYGFSGKIGAGTYDRRLVDERQPDKFKTGGGALPHTFLMNGGVAQVNDSATYSPVSDKLNVRRMTLQAANQERPYLRLATNWVLRTKPNRDAVLVLDGLWLGSDGPDAVILRGDYESVHIRSCTFDPGGKDMDDKPILPVPLVVEAQVEKLEIDDSIIHSIDSGVAVLVLPDSEAYLSRVTILGKLAVNRLWASEVLITAEATVTNTQEGCFRFSAAPPDSRLPRRYESHPVLEPNSLFTSTRFGDPGYGQLSETAPLELRRGAEDGSEIGAFSSLGNPIKLESLQAKVDEYMPFGLIPLFVYET